MNLPNLRDIFYQFELTNETTPEYDKLNEQIESKLNEAFPSFTEYNEIDILITNAIVESQVTGFEQGYRFAMGLIRGGADNES